MNLNKAYERALENRKRQKPDKEVFKDLDNYFTDEDANYPSDHD